MKVHLGERIYVIEFQHDISREVTACLIRDAGVPTPFSVVAEATVTRYYRDRPNREKARKAALAKVLDVMFPPIIPSKRHRLTLPLNRECRKAFWEVYLTRAQRSAEKALQDAGGAA